MGYWGPGCCAATFCAGACILLEVLSKIKIPHTARKKFWTVDVLLCTSSLYTFQCDLVISTLQLNSILISFEFCVAYIPSSHSCHHYLGEMSSITIFCFCPSPLHLSKNLIIQWWILFCLPVSVAVCSNMYFTSCASNVGPVLPTSWLILCFLPCFGYGCQCKVSLILFCFVFFPLKHLYCAYCDGLQIYILHYSILYLNLIKSYIFKFLVCDHCISIDYIW